MPIQLAKKLFFTIPTKLDLVLHFIVEHNSNDNFLQGAHDEVYASSGVAWDSVNLFVEGGNTKVQTEKVSVVHKDLTGTSEGKHYENGRPPFPILVHSFNLEANQTFPRNCNVELFVVEEDNENLAKTFQQYEKVYREKLSDAVAKGGEKVFGTVGGIVAGKVGAEIGVKIGKEVGSILKKTIGKILDEIAKGLSNDILQPFRFSLNIPDTKFEFGKSTTSLATVSSGLQTMDYRDGDAHYALTYEWILHRRFETLIFEGQMKITDTLKSNTRLRPDWILRSNNGKYQLIYQQDGNLVLYRLSDQKALWASGTDGQPAGLCIMQLDGNLVIYNPDGNAIWASNTWGDAFKGSNLVLQDDGNLVIYNKQLQAVWASNTVN